jgi:hypothetical protein
MDGEIKAVLEGNPKAADMVPEALEVMLDFNGREGALGIEPAIKPYRISVGKLPDDEDERETVIIQTLRRIQNIMQNHLNREEMLYNAATETNRQTGEVYIVVFATRNAAQYLADRISGDYPVLDQKGRKIIPGSSPGGPRPSP